MTTTEVRTSESGPDRPVDRTVRRIRPRTWIALVGMFVLLAGTMGYVAGDEIRVNTQFDGAHRSLDATRWRIAVVTGDLAVVRHDLAVVEGQVAVDSTTLANDATKLDGARTALADAEANVSRQSSATANLHLCLGGVERALNSVALGDPNRAASALTDVAGNCTMAVSTRG